MTRGAILILLTFALVIGVVVLVVLAWRGRDRTTGIVASKPSGEVAEYAERLVTNVMNEKSALVEQIRSRLENWALERVSVVDRTILRIALSELLYCPEVPANVIMNEAIEIARKFSSADAGSFVNGVLDRLAREVREG